MTGTLPTALKMWTAARPLRFPTATVTWFATVWSALKLMFDAFGRLPPNG